MKYIKKIDRRLAIGLVILILILLPVIRYKAYLHSHPSSSNAAREIQVKIPKGYTSGQIIDKLHKNGLITNPFYAKLYLKLNGYGNELASGVYLFNTGMSPMKLFDMLRKHEIDSNYVRLVIPEGYSLSQIGAGMLHYGLVESQQQLIDCVNEDTFNYSFLSDIPKDRNPRLEGYLYPATYEFEKGMSVHHIVDVMLKRFSVFYRGVKPELVKANRTLDKALTIASMVEEEAKADKDRRLISGVIYNRLKQNMRLQIDATVEYALGVHKSRIYLKDLKVDSPYNTYKYKGLPPGPISSPGEKSFEAALDPANNDYLFYVAMGDGTHYFTHSYRDFLKHKNSRKQQ